MGSVTDYREEPGVEGPGQGGRVAPPSMYDREGVSARVGGDDEILCALLQSMLHELDAYFATVQSAHDAAALTMSAHRFKGALLQTGLMAAARVAGAIESSALTGRFDVARGALPELQAEVVKARALLQEHVTELRRAGVCECECECSPGGPGAAPSSRRERAT
jgi:HPt (histidine-containing phosphotransfer) domain-containing protein